MFRMDYFTKCVKRKQARFYKRFVVASIIVCVCLLLIQNSAPPTQCGAVATTSQRWSTKLKDTLAPIKPGVSDSLAYELDYLPEETALRLPVCEDYKTAADLQESRLILLDNRLGYSLGDTISVSIRLYDGYGAPIRTGGADIRPRMFKENAAVAGRVADHGDGTYTATFEALWVGWSTITVKIAYTPEVIRSLYYIRKEFRGTSDFEAVYSTPDGVTEATLCHPTKEALLKANFTSTTICNLTYENSGQSWYCGKPTNKRLICEDWTGGRSKPRTDLPVTRCEWTLLKRSYQDMNDSVTVMVKGIRQDRRQAPETIVLPSTPCSSFDRSALWSMNQPTGFMYGNIWYLRHCRGYDKRVLSSCLQNKQILLSGDSTLRQWFQYIMWRWNCTLQSEEWQTTKWHKRTLCLNTKLNLTVQWLPHSQPFSAEEEINRYTRTSIARHLDETGNEDHVVVVIHVSSHLNLYHHSVFRLRMRRIRHSVENILKRNKYIKILIKGFHTYYSTNISIKDYLGKIYKHILYEEFAGLHSQVVFLEQKDITDALANFGLHPNGTIVKAMVDQTLSYICD